MRVCTGALELLATAMQISEMMPCFAAMLQTPCVTRRGQKCGGALVQAALVTVQLMLTRKFNRVLPDALCSEGWHCVQPACASVA